MGGAVTSTGRNAFLERSCCDWSSWMRLPGDSVCNVSGAMERGNLNPVHQNRQARHRHQPSRGGHKRNLAGHLHADRDLEVVLFLADVCCGGGGELEALVYLHAEGYGWAAK
jgi:hypothetical protein